VALALPTNVDGLWLIRHARAGSKRIWKAPDADRPLDALGHRHAADLVALFPQPPSALFASPTRRCVQTLQPIADAHALPIRQEERLGPLALLEELLTLLRDSGAAGAVFCTHGEVLERFYFALRSTVLHIEGPTEQILAKGVAWRMTTTTGGVTLAIHPPTPVALGEQGLLIASDRAVASLDAHDLTVLRCLPTGWSSDDIARATGLPRAEGKRRVVDFYRSLGVTNRVAAVQRAVELGLLSDRATTHSA
jgi:phosphohistidine phosphatase SixA